MEPDAMLQIEMKREEMRKRAYLQRGERCRGSNDREGPSRGSGERGRPFCERRSVLGRERESRESRSRERERERVD